MTQMSPNLQQHPLSAAFPAMPEQELEALAMDIEKNGQREPGVLFEGMVLDGWHRYLACQKAGRKFMCGDFGGDDPVAYVLSKNLHRRHLTASQRAAAVVTTANWRAPGARDAMVAPGATMTNEQMAEAAEVSPRTIRQAKVAHDAGLGDDVRAGAVSAKAAADVASLPPAKRAKAVKAIKEGKPPAPKKDKPKADDVDKLHARISALETRLGETKEALAEMTALAESAKAFEEKDEFKEMQVLRLELESCKRRRDELMRENAELKKMCAHWKKKAEK